jgi:CRP-like cAMP-binding protein
VATLNIARMVQEMQSAVATGVMEMDKFIAEMRYGVEDVGKISTQLSKIIDQVQALSPTFEDVNVAMENQSDNARQITDETLHLGGDMTQTMEALQESYSAIGQLNDAAQNLQNEVSRFQVRSSILEEIEIFHPFSDEAKTYLQQHMRGHHYAPGELIIQQGELTNSLYVIAKGVVSIQVRLQDGESLEVARYAVGQVLGEISLLTGEPRTADVLALSDCYAFEIKKEDIAPFIEAEPDIAERLSAILTERKLDTETKRNRYEAHQLDRDAEYTKILNKIQDFFGLGQ